MLLRQCSGKLIIHHHRNGVHILKSLVDVTHRLVYGEVPLLLLAIVAYSYNDLIKNPEPSQYDVLMSLGEGIK